ncbi:MAG: ytrA 2 [Phycisphaerales bacterium]|nr:ytrA 2 [Phycisphaerales bacterium]
MFIRVETSSGLPITRQIADQVRAHCAAGTLRPGDRLPSVRELARELAVNQNTVLRVYERLTTEGLLERRHGDGTFVADRLPPGRLKAERELLRQEVERIAHKAADLNVPPADLRAMLEAALAARTAGAAPPFSGENNDRAV